MNKFLSLSLLSKQQKKLLLTTSQIPISLLLINNDTSLTEKIIANNIQFSNLKYKITMVQMTELSNAIKCNHLQQYYANPIEKTQFIPFSPKDLTIEVNDLNPNCIYKISAELIEQIASISNPLLYSNEIMITPRYGLVTQELISKLHHERYKIRKNLCKSEKDSLKYIDNEIHYNELETVLPTRDIKSLTYQGRLYDDIDQFINSNNKCSKLMTDERKKKVLYSTQSRFFFENKMDRNLIKMEDNPFMKNEWFMGPVYSYDYNYNKYI